MSDIARSRARWRRAFFALLAIWALTVGWAAYTLLDHGVALTYQGESYRYLRNDMAVLAGLAPLAAPGVQRSELLAALRRQHPDALITATDTTVGIGQLEFRFGPDGRLRAVAHPELPDPARSSPAPGATE